MKVLETVFTAYSSFDDVFNFEGATLKGTIKRLQEILEQVPEQYRDEAQIEFDSSEQIELSVFFYRDETSMEKGQREAREQNERDKQRERDAAEYNRLKKVYGW